MAGPIPPNQMIKKVHRFRRLLRYCWLRLLRSHDSPQSLAGGFATGAAISCTPLIGPHLILSTILAKYLRMNAWTAAIGSGVGNPFTLPFLWAAEYWIGRQALPKSWQLDLDFASLSWSSFLETPLQLLLPIVIGCVPLSLFMWLLCYFGLKFLLERYNHRAHHP